MKTKYIKVSVSDRLPNKKGWYFIVYQNGEEDTDFYSDGKQWKNVEYWLQEVTDYEEEIKGMLESIYESFGQIWQIDDKNRIFEFIDPVEIEELLTKIKQ